MAPIKVLYIAGIYHSGSTLLDRSLSVAEDAVGFGEISKSYFDGHEEYCSCGKQSTQCEFWGHHLSQRMHTHDEFYDSFFQKFKEHYGCSSVLIDSSKTSPFRLFKSATKRWQGLSYWSKHRNEVELIVIHLVRDPRSWTASLKRRDKRLQENSSSFSVKNFFRKDVVRLCQWYLSHTFLSAYIKKNDLKSIKVCYESFCSNPKETVNSIYNRASLPDKSITLLDLNKSKSHITVGNPSRHDTSIKNTIKYDTRWMAERFSFAFNIMHFFAHLYYLKLIKEDE